ncbi:hypothetical protein St11Ph5_00036 [Escherichia phage St11Ph5]|uniref:Uncharacterized protein n=1 Tax=Escherichia phage St11Ph5 TaxID=2047765 RepID=A0A2D2W359_9CAUD|nr:hypothetical protein PP767_gp36 [Escherichia phage St11Ph5]ATS92499.1 hypothetical protein St11Ph5_00036 [Escherichia phage St11Ph5]
MLALGKTIHDQVESEIEADIYTRMQVLIKKNGLLPDPFIHTFPQNLI